MKMMVFFLLFAKDRSKGRQSELKLPIVVKMALLKSFNMKKNILYQKHK